MRSLKMLVVMIALVAWGMLFAGCATNRARIPFISTPTPLPSENEASIEESDDYHIDPGDGLLIVKKSAAFRGELYREKDYNVLVDKNAKDEEKKEIQPVRIIEDYGALPSNGERDKKTETRVFQYHFEEGVYWLGIQYYYLHPLTRKYIYPYKTDWIKIEVDKTPMDYIDGEYTLQKWGWIATIEGKRIPRMYWDPKKMERTEWDWAKGIFWFGGKKNKKPWRLEDRREE